MIRDVEVLASTTTDYSTAKRNYSNQYNQQSLLFYNLHNRRFFLQHSQVSSSSSSSRPPSDVRSLKHHSPHSIPSFSAFSLLTNMVVSYRTPPLLDAVSGFLTIRCWKRCFYHHNRAIWLSRPYRYHQEPTQTRKNTKERFSWICGLQLGILGLKHFSCT